MDLNRLPARFWAKVDRSSDEGCWVWTAACTQDGYGHFRVGKRTLRAHRFAYENLVGPIPNGLDLDHLCRVRACVNPRHLEPVTRKENGMRGFGWCAEQARKTHCHNGHPFDEENTYAKPSGGRACRKCNAADVRRYNERRKAAAS